MAAHPLIHECNHPGTSIEMNGPRSLFLWIAAVGALASYSPAQSPTQPAPAPTASQQQVVSKPKAYSEEQAERGEKLFRQDCSFCHGRDAMGGESGPNLTKSKLVRTDVDGDKIGQVIRAGRTTKGMPAFDRSDDQIMDLVAFIHTQQNSVHAAGGGRKGVEVADLQTGNVQAGKQYFDGAGGCSKCHSPTGDLAGIATRYKGLELEQHMLYPEGAKSKVTITPKSGESITGTLAYQDEFTIALRDASNNYKSFRVRDVKFKVDSPADAHAELFPKYTDSNIHDLMAYLQTLQ
jgi:cytochrome c oxidase cbb3-type subunit 3